MGKLSVQTRDAWNEWLCSIDLGAIEFKNLMCLEHATWIFFMLKEAADTPELFPKGKSASLQHFEMLIANAAKEELHYRENELK